MRRLVLAGFLTAAGLLGGMFIVADDRLLGGFMGAILGAMASVIVFAFPRNRDYPPDNWFRD